MNRGQLSRLMLVSRLMLMTCVAVVLGTAWALDRSPAAMAEAANRFLGALTPEQRSRAVFGFASPEREHWGFEPTEVFPRQGLPMNEMSAPQRKLAHDLLKSGLSERGYQTATAIMDRETIVKALEGAARVDPARAGILRPVRDSLKYYVSVFGTPGSRGAWGWRIEGNHLSLNFTVVDGSLVASSPAFFGAYPATVAKGTPTAPRLLATEEDTGRALLMALDARQRAKAIVVPVAPNDVSTNVKPTVLPLPPVGVPASEMLPDQRELLMRLIESYTSMIAGDIAADRMARLRNAGAEKIIFTWAGDVEPGKPHYYRIQGPTFLIEFVNSQDGANHIHSVWRDFKGDFGRDLLQQQLPVPR